MLCSIFKSIACFHDCISFVFGLILFVLLLGDGDEANIDSCYSFNTSETLITYHPFIHSQLHNKCIYTTLNYKKTTI